MDELNFLLEASFRYGFPLVLSIFLIIYVYKHQECIDKKTDEREKQYYTREIEYREFMTKMRLDIADVSADSNKVIKETSDSVDALDIKILSVEHKVAKIEDKVDIIDRKVDHLNMKTDFLNKMSNEQVI